MEPEDWLRQMVDKIAQIGIEIDETLVWEQPLEWPCTWYIEVESLTSESLDKALRLVVRETNMAERNVLVTARLAPNDSGGYEFGRRVQTFTAYTRSPIEA